MYEWLQILMVKENPNQSLKSYYFLKPYKICYKNIISSLGTLQQSTVVNILHIQPLLYIRVCFCHIMQNETQYMLGAYFVSAIYNNVGVKRTDFRYNFISMDKIVDMILSV